MGYSLECALCEHSIVMNQIVGVLFGLTDYAYWLYVTDTEGNIDMSTTHDLKVMGEYPKVCVNLQTDVR